MRLCEITLKKEKLADSAASSKRPNILHRRIEVPELKGSVRLKASTEGMQIIQSAGGLVKFIEQCEDKKLSKKLRSIKQKLLDKGIIKAAEPEKIEKEAPAAKAAAEGGGAEKTALEAATEAPKEEKADKEEKAKEPAAETTEEKGES